jgi:hypothetical protein
MITGCRYIDDFGIIYKCNVVDFSNNISPYWEIIDTRGIRRLVDSINVFIEVPLPFDIRLASEQVHARSKGRNLTSRSS